MNHDHRLMVALLSIYIFNLITNLRDYDSSFNSDFIFCGSHKKHYTFICVCISVQSVYVIYQRLCLYAFMTEKKWFVSNRIWEQTIWIICVVQNHSTKAVLSLYSRLKMEINFQFFSMIIKFISIFNDSESFIFFILDPSMFSDTFCSSPDCADIIYI